MAATTLAMMLVLQFSIKKKMVLNEKYIPK